MYKQYSAVA